MGFLRLVRAALVVGLVVAAIGIAVANPSEKVTIDLLFGPPYVDVPLVFALFVAFLVGGVGGCAVSFLWVVELQTKLRDAKRQSRRLQGELTSLRNLPLDETDDVPVETRT
jgi:uncharacterized integral membrane protein